MVKYVNQCVTKARDEVIKCEFCPQQRDTLRKRINATVKKKKIKKKMDQLQIPFSHAFSYLSM